MQQFATSFYEADILFVVDIYPAGEAPLPGVDSEMLSEEIKKYGHKNVHYISDNLLEMVLKVLKPGDMLLTLGAGNIGTFSREILKNLEK